VTDLCTIAQVKTESAGRITGETLDTDIAYKITDLSEKILEIDSTLTSDDRTARMCCIYGVLGVEFGGQHDRRRRKIRATDS